MQKKINIFLSLLLVISLVVFLTGCNIMNGLEGLNPEAETLKSEEEVKTKLGNNYQIAVRYSSQDNESGKMETSYNAIIKKAGNCIIYSDTSGGDQVSTVMINENKLYQYDSDNDKYVYSTTLSNEEVNYYTSALTLVFSISNLGEISYTKKESTTFLNRPCTKYEYEIKMNVVVGSFNSNVTYIFDDETGICFKFSTTMKASAVGEIPEEEAGSFEVTSFKMGSVNLDSEIAKIDVETENNNQGGNEQNTNVPEGYGKYVNQGAVVLYSTDEYQECWMGGIEKIDGSNPWIRVSILGYDFSILEDKYNEEYGSLSDFELVETTINEYNALVCTYSNYSSYCMEVAFDLSYLNDQYWPAAVIKVEADKNLYDINIFNDSTIWDIINSFYFDKALKYNY